MITHCIYHNGDGFFRAVIKIVHRAVERGLMEGAVKLPSGYLIPTGQLPSLKATV